MQGTSMDIIKVERIKQTRRNKNCAKRKLRRDIDRHVVIAYAVCERQTGNQLSCKAWTVSSESILQLFRSLCHTVATRNVTLNIRLVVTVTKRQQESSAQWVSRVCIVCERRKRHGLNFAIPLMSLEREISIPCWPYATEFEKKNPTEIGPKSPKPSITCNIAAWINFSETGASKLQSPGVECFSLDLSFDFLFRTSI